MNFYLPPRRCLLASFLLLSVVGCPGPADNKIATDKAAASPGAALAVVKDGKPFIMADLGSDAAKADRLDSSAKQVFLMRQAASIAIDKGLGKKEFVGMPQLVVRLVLVEGRDEYQRPKWGNAKEYGLFELDRAKLEKIEQKNVSELGEPALRLLFVASKGQ